MPEFEDFQSFRSPKDKVYNITVAGAPGGRGICNTMHGRGMIISTQAELTPETTLIILVGQNGGSPFCSSSDYFPWCEGPPLSLKSAVECGNAWFDNINAIAPEIFSESGGGGGGGASMIRVIRGRYDVATYPLIIAGAGGGSSTIITNYTLLVTQYESNLTSEELYQTYMDAKVPDINSRGGERGTTSINDTILRSGVGGGYIYDMPYSQPKVVDGENLYDEPIGGEECFMGQKPFLGAVGGYGGGGGGCGGGGGGGGFTGGDVLGAANTLPGGGGISYVGNFSTHLNFVQYFINNRSYGYVDIVAANCDCVHVCTVHSKRNKYECLCPNNTQLAPDLNDCYYSECSYTTKLTLRLYK